jgi:hypothetical protein
MKRTEMKRTEWMGVIIAIIGFIFGAVTGSKIAGNKAIPKPTLPPPIIEQKTELPPIDVYITVEWPPRKR